MDFSKKLSLLVFLVCVLISLKNQRGETDSRSVLGDPSAPRNLVEEGSTSDAGVHELVCDYYRQSCPLAEHIIGSTVQELYQMNISVAPAFLRLVFHDCFVTGCDASILLDSDDQIKSEKDSPPNLSIKGFEEIDIIKSKLEQACPGVVSCSDIVVLAAREGVILSGGQFYPVLTGRKDSKAAFPLNATQEIPHPDFHLADAINSFASKGFDERETVALLGAHSIGTIHCSFIRGRLSNFSGTNGPDPSINPEFVEVLESQCSGSGSGNLPPSSPPSQSPSPSPAENSSPTASLENQAMRMDYEGPGKNFGKVYYSSLLQGKGLLFVDQQLTSASQTKNWVEIYASDLLRFRRDFGLAMMKLSHLQGFTEGDVRLNCRKVNV